MSTQNSPSTNAHGIGPLVGRWDRFTSFSLWLAGIAAVGGFATLFSFIAAQRPFDTREQIRIANDAYVIGNYRIAARLAAATNVTDDDPEYMRRTRAFLIGAGRVQQAQNQDDPPTRRRMLRLAIPALRAAGDTGFPAGRGAAGYRLLGTAYRTLDQHEQAAVALRLAMEEDPTLTSELSADLIDSKVRSATMSETDAVKQLATLATRQRMTGGALIDNQLQRADLLRRAQRFDAAMQLIDQARPEPSMSQRKQRIAMARLEIFADSILRPATPDAAPIRPVNDLLKRLQRLERDSTDQIAAAARLWSARVYAATGNIDAALQQYIALRSQQSIGPQTVIGGIEEIELLESLQRDNSILSVVQYVVRQLGTIDGIDGRLISPGEFISRLKQVVVAIGGRGNFDIAAQIAAALPPLVPSHIAMQLQAGALNDWAADLLKRGQQPSGQIDPDLANLARQKYRAAGDALEAAANQVFAKREFVPLVWKAIVAYENGRRFGR
ncbi:MAG: hypothetical protein AAFP90_14535, partial [Planctomycetota bacterium]